MNIRVKPDPVFWLLQVHNGVYILRIICCAYASFETLVGETLPTEPWQDVNLCSTLFLSNLGTYSCSFWRSYLWVIKFYSADWLTGTCEVGYLYNWSPPVNIILYICVIWQADGHIWTCWAHSKLGNCRPHTSNLVTRKVIV